MDEIKRTEIEILAVLPTYFIHIPTFKSCVRSILGLLEKNEVSTTELDNIEQQCVTQYVESDSSLDVSGLIVEPTVNLVFSAHEISRTYEMLRGIFVSHSISAG